MKHDDDVVYDVAVIGAGINGAGIARDAALRGLKVVILDKGDMCNATSWISSRLIHGGLRYLEYAEIPLVYESLHERRWLRRIAAHLVQPLRINIPIYKGAKRGRLLIRMGMIAYDLLSWNKALPRHDMLDGAEIRDAEPGLNDDGLVGAARYFDAQVTYAERLVLENLLAATAAGAKVLTYSKVVEMSTRDNLVDRVMYEDRDGDQHTLRVASVVNAAGPWVDDVLKTAAEPMRRYIGGAKGSHIIVDRFAGAPSDAFYVEAESDGRPFFIIPWNDQYLIGTTDTRYNDDLDNVRANREEIDYLLSETNRVFPRANLSIDDIHYTYAGVRPLPYKEKGPESAITRRHIIKVNTQIASNLVSIIGGKLTTYRNLAEQCVDKLARILHRRLPECRTHTTVLPGAWGVDRARERLEALGDLDHAAVDRLLRIYGGRASEIAALAADDSRTLAPGLLAAEIVYSLRFEFPQTLADVIFRRTMLGLEAGQGRDHYASVAEICATYFSWDDARKQDELDALIAYADSLLVA